MMARAVAVVVASVWLIPAALAAQAGRVTANGPIVITHNPPSPSQHPSPSPPPPAAPQPPQSPQTSDVFLAGPYTYAPRYDRRSLPPRRHQRFPGYGYGVGFGYGYVEDEYARRADRSYDERARDGETGYLRLQVEPGTAEVYVDGLYTGSVDDHGPLSVGRALEIGPHRVEIRAPGFQTVTLDIRILPHEMITYRRTLQRSEDRIESRLPTSTAPPRTFYVIPRCYAGDTRPRAEALPAGCKIASLRTIPPIIDAPPR